MHFHRPKVTRSTIAVIPMIDILFVLLVFFIVSTSFKKPRVGKMRQRAGIQSSQLFAIATIGQETFLA